MAINFIEDVSVAGSVEATTKVITSEVESASTILLDAAADITIDAGGQDIILSDDGTIFGTLSNSSGFQIRSRVNNADMFFRGVDDGTEFNALTLDMSSAGYATFNSGIAATTGYFTSTVNVASPIYHIGDTDTYFGFSGNDTFQVQTGGNTALTLDSSQDATFTGSITASIAADGDSTYTGIVVSESGLLKYRTKAQIRSDIGAGTGSGNVSNTGTPVDNQLAIWTDATTIEGNSNLTFSGTVLTVHLKQFI